MLTLLQAGSLATAEGWVEELLRQHRSEISRVARAHEARQVRVFASIARGDARPDSDVDLLVDLQPGQNFLDLVAIKQDIEDLLGREVDVVTERAVSPYFRAQVLKEAVPL